VFSSEGPGESGKLWQTAKVERNFSSQRDMGLFSTPFSPHELGHVTCFSKWDMSKWDSDKDLKNAYL
jgi:hypothetical protein